MLQHAAWGPGASLRGALFLNSETYDEGAVGCMLRGPLRFDQLCWQVRSPVASPQASEDTSWHPRGYPQPMASPLADSAQYKLLALHEGSWTAWLYVWTYLDLESACIQGCRPVGKVVEVTEAKGNSITELDGLPALEVVRCNP